MQGLSPSDHRKRPHRCDIAASKRIDSYTGTNLHVNVAESNIFKLARTIMHPSFSTKFVLLKHYIF